MNKLYVTAVHIGNPDDITLRALKILKQVDLVVGEEFKFVSKLLKYYGIKNKFDALNEHNSEYKTEELIKFLKSGKSISLISDHGTPAIADPGSELVDKCYKNKIEVICVPGVSSITAALCVSGIKINDFIFFSKTPRKKHLRKKFFLNLKNDKNVKVFIDAPYRLKNLVENIKNYISENAFCILCFELTTKNEKIFRGTSSKILNIINQKNMKGEFILIVDKPVQFKKN